MNVANMWRREALDVNDPPIRASKARIRPVRVAGSIVAVAVVVLIVSSFVFNKRIDWELILGYLLHPQVLQGVLVTIGLTITSVLIGGTLGILLAVGQTTGNILVKATCRAYIFVVRGTPVLVQLFFWFNLGALFPQLVLWLPFFGEVVSWDTNRVVTGTVAAIIGLGLNEGAYLAEIVRGGVQAVPRGHIEAAKAVGLTQVQTWRLIILPSALRTMIPVIGNEFITLLKATALVSVVAGADLLTQVQRIYSLNFRVIELLLVAAIWYLVLVSLLSLVQRSIEDKYAKRLSKRM